MPGIPRTRARIKPQIKPRVKPHTSCGGATGVVRAVAVGLVCTISHVATASADGDDDGDDDDDNGDDATAQTANTTHTTRTANATHIISTLTASTAGTKMMRVLVTGFHDWKDLGDPPNIWKCRDNPSCRLIFGKPCNFPPSTRPGVLPAMLKRMCPEQYSFDFHSIPVVWGASSSLDLSGYDVAIHIGLGVYDTPTTLILEDGAYNQRRGKDAIGASPKGGGTVIDSEGPSILSNERVSESLRSFHGTKTGGCDIRRYRKFNVKVLSARASNAYLCNETNWRALSTLQQLDSKSSQSPESSRLKAAYFIHIPYASSFQKEGTRSVPTPSVQGGGHDRKAGKVGKINGEDVVESTRQQQQQQVEAEMYAAEGLRLQEHADFEPLGLAVASLISQICAKWE